MSPDSTIQSPDEETAARGQRDRRRSAAHERLVRQRRLVAVGGVAALALLVGVVSGAGSGSGGGNSGDGDSKPKLSQLPGGGRSIFPQRTVVAFYGAPQDEELGVLGIGSPEKAAAKLVAQAKPFATRRKPVLPAFELLADVAAGAPGSDNLYRTRQHPTVIRKYLKAARKAHAILLLDIQPGRADFLTEAKALKPWLEQPDVGLALDPEWRMTADQVPGQMIGSVSSQEVNSVSGWLSGIVRAKKLPEKLFVVHRFTDGMIQQPDQLQSPPGLAVTLNVDGFGTAAEKLAKYRDLVPRKFYAGFKLFYKEDKGLMKPSAVLKLKPQPSLIVYE